MTHEENLSAYLKAKQAYYFGTPIMSDAQFDILEEDIREVNPHEPALKLIGAPLPKTTAHQKAKHLIPMGSQEKVNSFEELQRWERLRENNPSARFHASYKADGGSLGLYYENGRLQASITRGDGLEGEEITAQGALFQGVPLQLKKPLNIGVRCEAIVTLADWPKADPGQTSNPRNVACGILGRLDGEKARYVTALAFDFDNLPSSDDKHKHPDVDTEDMKAKALSELGFLTVPSKGNLTLSEVEVFFKETEEKRNKGELPFWIDGMVIRYEDISAQRKLGISDGRPKGQVAWKFPAERVKTILVSVEWQVGHTGAVTPIASVKPVRIGGTTVSKASLANTENIKTLGAFIGAEVEVIKAGDIIPQITKVLNGINPSQGHLPIETPTDCPICGKPLEKRKNVDGSDSVVLFCTNPDCEARTLGKIKRFCKSRDILGLGDSVICALVDKSIVANVQDLYQIKAEDIENIEINAEKGVRLGRKRADAIVKEIDAKGKTMSLAEFLGAFGTRSLGVRRATLMLEANPKLEELEAWFGNSLQDPDFAAQAGVPKLGAVILEGLKENEATIRETLKFVTLSAPVTAAPRAQGSHTICITGSLPSGKKKKEYAPLLAAAGHQLVDDLSKEVSHLVMADPNGPESSKTKKAKSLGIPLQDELWLQNLLLSAKPAAPSNTTSTPATSSEPTNIQTPTMTTDIQTPTPKTTLSDAIIRMVNVLVKKGFSFSAHDITKLLREAVNMNAVELDGCSPDLKIQIGPIAHMTVEINHDTVKSEVHTHFETGKMPGYARTHKTSDRTKQSYWEYSSQTGLQPPANIKALN